MPANDRGYEQGLSNLALDKASFFLEKIQGVRVWLQVTANRMPASGRDQALDQPVSVPSLLSQANGLELYLITHHSSIVVNIRSDEGLTLETSALYSLRWPIYIFNLVDTTKL